MLLQELCAALRGAGAKVVVIDDGRSFEHSVKLQGGRFVEFTLASGFSLNPFSMVDDARAHEDEDYRLDCFAMINAIVGQMARPSAAPSDTERGLIDRAVTQVWNALGGGGAIDDVAHALHQSDNEAGKDLATAIAPFCRGGSYAGFFGNLADHYRSAEPVARRFFAQDLQIAFLIAAGGLALLRLPAFLRHLDRRLAEGSPRHG